MARLRYWPLLAAAGWGVFCAATLSLNMHGGGDELWIQGLSLLAGLVLLTLLLFSGERPLWPAWSRWAMCLGGIAAVFGPYELSLHSAGWRVFSTIGLVAVALPVGYWIGDRMEKASNLIPLAIALSMADIYSVFRGPSRHVGEAIISYQRLVADRVAQLGQVSPAEIAKTEASLRAPLANYLVAHFPLPGQGTTVPLLGIGDFIALAFLFRAAWVHRLNARAVFIAGLASTIVALAVTQLVGHALPALPFIALGVVGYLALTNPRVRRLSRQEVLLSIAVPCLFGALLVVGWLTGRP